MLLNSVVIVLREVLEAALLMSVFLASASLLSVRNYWVVIALTSGLLGAALYGYSLAPISELFDGVGQEVGNASLQFLAFVCLTAVAFQIPRRIANPGSKQTTVLIFMALTTALAITREGAEIIVYVSGFTGMSDFFSAVAIGSIVGACIGFSVGVLIYYLLRALPARHTLPTILILLMLIAAGMASQATRLLIQADWLSAAGAVWDTSAILSEQSLPGQLLYALVGYEASPSMIEVLVYLGSIALVAATYWAGRVMSGLRAGEAA
jgi:high-affinity iron transporter